MKKEIKDNEILIFTDFNNTFVDFHAEYDYNIQFYDDFQAYLDEMKSNLTRCLKEFERSTGLTPVICIVTNASMNIVDNNGYRGICHDLMMIFFNHGNFSDVKIKQEVDNSCEKYIRFVMHKENDGFFEINPYGRDVDDTFIPRAFSEEAMQIKRDSLKRESVERFIHDIGPLKSEFAIFAGNSIQDDYPMKYAVSDKNVRRIFIRPGKVKHIKPSIMQQFCMAKGVLFDCVNPKNNKKIKTIDDTNFHLLSEQDREILMDYADNDTVLLTSRNSRGFVEGINQCREIICEYNKAKKETENEAKIFD